jgi:hypothetical protein
LLLEQAGGFHYLKAALAVADQSDGPSVPSRRCHVAGNGGGGMMVAVQRGVGKAGLSQKGEQMPLHVVASKQAVNQRKARAAIIGRRRGSPVHL